MISISYLFEKINTKSHNSTYFFRQFAPCAETVPYVCTLTNMKSCNKYLDVI